MSKYLDYTSNKFTQEHYNRQYTYPYVAYSNEEDRVIYSLDKNNSDQPTNPNYGSSEYLTFTALEDNSSVGLEFLSTQQTIEYSYDKSSWTNMDTNTTISLNTNNKVYLRGILSGDNHIETTDAISTFDITTFNMTGKIAASGNCNSIWNYQDLNAPLKVSCGAYLFYNCTPLITAPELPATTLAESCYSNMFKGCISLTTAPEILPATTLAESCYSCMFYGCASLTTAPELPATTLAYNCYFSMFSNCGHLTIAPELPATTLADWCYCSMFLACTSLTAAPKLPATELADYCYCSMFTWCASLTTAPELPATELAESCYYGMFQNCTSLVTAPELPATTLVTMCYYEMFKGCSKINSIKCLATNHPSSSRIGTWVEGVSSIGTFYKHPDMNNWTRGASGIPEGWVVVDAEI